MKAKWTLFLIHHLEITIADLLKDYDSLQSFCYAFYWLKSLPLKLEVVYIYL